LTGRTPTTDLPAHASLIVNVNAADLRQFPDALLTKGELINVEGSAYWSCCTLGVLQCKPGVFWTHSLSFEGLDPEDKVIASGVGSLVEAPSTGNDLLRRVEIELDQRAVHASWVKTLVT